MTRKPKGLASDVWRAVRTPAIVIAIYLALNEVFVRVVSTHGLIAPSGAPNLWIALFAIGVLGVRVVVLTLLPAMLVHRLVVVIGRRLFGLDRSPRT